jgi:hypothetical protein
MTVATFMRWQPSPLDVLSTYACLEDFSVASRLRYGLFGERSEQQLLFLSAETRMVEKSYFQSNHRGHFPIAYIFSQAENKETFGGA